MFAADGLAVDIVIIIIILFMMLLLLDVVMGYNDSHTLYDAVNNTFSTIFLE